jgi:ATP-dependent DNA helicase RecG
MLSIAEIKVLMQDMESDRVERTISFKEDKLGPAACAFSNDLPNHSKLWVISINLILASKRQLSI